MLHFTCDLCGKELRPGEDQRFVVKIEAFAAHDPAELTEEDLDEDHMEAISQLLRENGVALAIPDRKPIESLRRAVRYLMAIERVESKKKQHKLTKDQDDQLKERRSPWFG